MISINVNVIHNNALEFYRANTSRAASLHTTAAVFVLFVRLALLTIFTCILCSRIGVANKMQCLRHLWAYSKHNVANFLMNSLRLGVALKSDLAVFWGFLADNDKTTNDRQTNCFTPCLLLYFPISQAYSSILP